MSGRLLLSHFPASTISVGRFKRSRTGVLGYDFPPTLFPSFDNLTKNSDWHQSAATQFFSFSSGRAFVGAYGLRLGALLDSKAVVCHTPLRKSVYSSIPVDVSGSGLTFGHFFVLTRKRFTSMSSWCAAINCSVVASAANLSSESFARYCQMVYL